METSLAMKENHPSGGDDWPLWEIGMNED